MLNAFWSSITSGGPAVIMIAAALAVMMFFWGLASSLGRSFDPARRRLDEIAADSGAPPSASLGQRIADALRPVEWFVLPKDLECESTQQQLQFAGYRSISAVTTFYGAKLALSAGMLLIWLSMARFLPHISSGRIVFFGLAASFFGISRVLLGHRGHFLHAARHFFQRTGLLACALCQLLAAAADLAGGRSDLLCADQHLPQRLFQVIQCSIQRLLDARVGTGRRAGRAHIDDLIRRGNSDDGDRKERGHPETEE